MPHHSETEKVVFDGGPVAIGIDIVEIVRVGSWLRRFAHQELTSVFSAAELALAYRTVDAPLCLAVSFGAKEAVGKALETGLTGVELPDITALPSETGLHLELCGSAGQKAASLRIARWWGAWSKLDTRVLVLVAGMPTNGYAPLRYSITEIVRVDSLARMLRHYEDLTPLLHPDETRHITPGRFMLSRIASRIAAKLAIGRLLRIPELNWLDVQIKGGIDAPPRLLLTGRAAERAAQRTLGPVHVSLTRKGDTAAAFIAAGPAARHS
jgi:holo-[acyl-carrier-protein] synthase